MCPRRRACSARLRLNRRCAPRSAAERESGCSKRSRPSTCEGKRTSRCVNSGLLWSTCSSASTSATIIIAERTSHYPTGIGRSLPINVNGAIPAVMLDVGFPVGALKGISLLARTASLIGHLQEEIDRPIGFVMSGAAAQAITYDGPGAA